MAYDTPYRVEHVVECGKFDSVKDVFLIMRSGEDVLCRCDRASFAYKLVEVLNDHEHSTDIHR